MLRQPEAHPKPSARAGATELPPMDASGVDVVDGAGMQLLLSLQHSLHERGLGLRLAAPVAS